MHNPNKNIKAINVTDLTGKSRIQYEEAATIKDVVPAASKATAFFSFPVRMSSK
jgi:hypothetical protein